MRIEGRRFKIDEVLIDKKRYNILLLIVFVILCVYISRLVDWQIINVEEYRERAKNSNTYSIKTDAVRGEILDTNGIGLAINSSGYRVIIERLNIDRDKENGVILSTIKILDSLKCNWIDILPINVNDNNEFEFKSDNSSQIFSLRKYLNLSDEASAAECMKKLIDKYKCYDFSPKEQRNIVSVRYNISKTNGNSAATPYILADNISKEAMLVLSELSADIKGIRVETS